MVIDLAARRALRDAPRDDAAALDDIARGAVHGVLLAVALFWLPASLLCWWWWR